MEPEKTAEHLTPSTSSSHVRHGCIVGTVGAWEGRDLCCFASYCFLWPKTRPPSRSGVMIKQLKTFSKKCEEEKMMETTLREEV